VIFDGAMGTSIQRYGLSASDFGGERYEGCNDILSVTRPDLIEEIHASFLAVGADVIETNTFRSNRITLSEYGLDDRVAELNRASAELARRVADRFSTADKPRFVAGSLGLSGKLPSSTDSTLGDITYGELVEVFREQSLALLEGGVDILLVETSQDILEVKAAVRGIKLAMEEAGVNAALQVQVTLDVTGRMLLGTEIGAVLTILEPLGIDVIGLNCSTGPDYMRDPVRYLTTHTDLPVSAIPNAGLPRNVDGEAVYPMEPEPMASMLADFVKELGCNIVGGCCGTTPEHIAAIVAMVEGENPWSHRPGEPDRTPRIASPVAAVELDQEPKPLLVGERLNAQGSRKVKRLLLEGEYDALVEIAREQIDAGAHALDVCVALTEREDEAEQMARVVKLLAASVSAPLVIDSTEATVIRAALETYGGRAVVNSINLENGLERVRQVLPLVKEHGAVVIALTIDEEGMAQTAERKLSVARRIYDLALSDYGLHPHDLVFDVLTFPVTTGQKELRRAAVETLEGVRLVKENLPGVYTILGVSNVSFGLTPAARRVINSVFLHHAVEAGLDMAIINPAHVIPYGEIPSDVREMVDALVFDRDEDALPRVISYFESTGGEEVALGGQPSDPTEGMDVYDKIHWHIVHRRKEGIDELIDLAVERSDAVWVLNHVLLPAMKEVGDKFGAGELILPFVLQSAEVMKKAVARLERYLERKEGQQKGTVVLATVYGDVHDIGKNLVGTILSNNGYKVVDLGKQVPVNTIIDAAVEHDATAIGLSALLVSTSKQMPICVQELHSRGHRFPVLIGGAAINRRFGYRILFVGENTEYEPGVFYCKDAFEGLSVMDKLTSDERDAFVESVKAAARKHVLGRTPEAAAASSASDEGRDSTSRTVPRAPSIPRPRRWGVVVLGRDEIEIDEVVRCFDLETLFRLHWGGRGKRGAEWSELVEKEFIPRLRRMQRELVEKRWLGYGAVYGIFPAAAEGDELVVFDPDDREHEIARWRFPRQQGRRHLCLTDYFLERAEGMDVVGLQVVTAGPEATARIEELQGRGDYTEAYYLAGFASQLAEGLAEWVHRRVREEMRIAPDRGLRYSWGYPACPDLRQQEDVLRILGAKEALGVELTEGYQLVPEHSTAAIVVHHPKAIYFSTGYEKRERERMVEEVLGDIKSSV